MHANMRAPITIRPLTIPAYLPRRVGTSHETMTLYSTDIKVRELTPPENSVTIATVVLSPFKITRRCGRRGVVHNKSSWDWFLRCVLISQSVRPDDELHWGGAVIDSSASVSVACVAIIFEISAVVSGTFPDGVSI